MKTIGIILNGFLLLAFIIAIVSNLMGNNLSFELALSNFKIYILLSSFLACIASIFINTGYTKIEKRLSTFSLLAAIYYLILGIGLVFISIYNGIGLINFSPAFILLLNGGLALNFFRKN